MLAERTPVADPPGLTDQQVAQLYGKSSRTIRHWRQQGYLRWRAAPTGRGARIYLTPQQRTYLGLDPDPYEGKEPIPPRRFATRGPLPDPEP